jgi:hypothetical protein
VVFAIEISDEDAVDAPPIPTEPQIFGIFLARSLKKCGLLAAEHADALQRGWNADPG